MKFRIKLINPEGNVIAQFTYVDYNDFCKKMKFLRDSEYKIYSRAINYQYSIITYYYKHI